ncbi:MobA/MobL family protein [Salaquimonas pukyongi]|uniref:MobA/MobL family protein n=1 Tax=Salaquimonas pukyongi TaxID=2712698 RepID=UPI0009FB4B08|nr:MobA/MobL family protein [Salaquimonas pukyongi]
MQDGNVHCHVGNISLRKGSALGSAAYVSGQRLRSERESRWVDFDHRADVVFSEIILPKGAPVWAANRTALWNGVEAAAQRKDARVAKSIEVAITRDIPASAREALAREFVAPFVAMGCVADVAIHEDGTDHNPHIHILLTTRLIEDEGFGKKIEDLEKRKFVKDVRSAWADLSNKYLEAAGSSVRVDHRSYSARGIEMEPSRHRGPDRPERQTKRERAEAARAVQPVREETAPQRKQENEIEEEIMREPTSRERADYPLLTEREQWPPDEEPTPDMTLAERAELHRYREEKKLDRLEAEYLQEPEERLAPARETVRSEQDRTGAEETRDEPRVSSRAALYEMDLEMDAAMRDRIASYESDLYLRATNMSRTDEERELLDLARGATPEVREAINDRIMFRRLERLREEDTREREKALERLIDETRRKALKQVQDNEEMARDPGAYPVPGPDGELLPPDELEDAIDKMIAEYEQPDPGEQKIEQER